MADLVPRDAIVWNRSSLPFKIFNVPRLPPGSKRIKNWYHSKFQLFLATFSLLIPNLCSAKSKSCGNWILVSHWPIQTILRPLSGSNVAWNIWNFEWYQFFILLNSRGHRVPLTLQVLRGSPLPENCHHDYIENRVLQWENRISGSKLTKQIIWP